MNFFWGGGGRRIYRNADLRRELSDTGNIKKEKDFNIIHHFVL